MKKQNASLMATDRRLQRTTDVKTGTASVSPRDLLKIVTAVVLQVSDDKSKVKADISNFGTTTTIELEAGSFDLL